MRALINFLRRAKSKYNRIPVVARAGMWFVVCTMLQKCVSFVTVPIFTRLMPTDEYGLYSTYLSWYSILTVFCTLNMHNVIYVNNYTKADEKQKKDEAAIPLLSLSIVITLGVFLVYLLLHRYLDEIIGLPFILVCLLFAQIFFEPPVNFWSMQQRFEYRYIQLFFRTIGMVLLNSALGIAFVWVSSKNEAVARALSIVLVQCIFGGAFYVYFWKKACFAFSTNGWKHALNVQLPLLPHSLSLTVLSSSDRIMIRNMVSAGAAGIYSVAYSAGYVVNVLKTSIVDALRPWLYQKIKKEEYEVIRKTVNAVMICILMISVVFTAFAPEVIFIMAPKQYHEAIYVIPPVAASSYFTFLYNIFSIVGMYYEKTKKIMWASVSGALLNLVLNFVCIRMFGYIAAAYTTLICYMFFSFAHYCIMKSICRENLNNISIFDVRFILMMSVIMIASSVVLIFTYEHILIRYSIIGILIVSCIMKRRFFISLFESIKKKNIK